MSVEGEKESTVGELDVAGVGGAGDEASRESSGAGRAAEEEAAIGAELRQLGDRLAAAIRAAVDTDEAAALRGEVKEGISRVRRELDDALKRAPLPGRGTGTSAAGEGGAEPGSATARGDSLRGDIARSLRGLAERLASAIEPGQGAGNGDRAGRTGASGEATGSDD